MGLMAPPLRRIYLNFSIRVTRTIGHPLSFMLGAVALPH